MSDVSIVNISEKMASLGSGAVDDDNFSDIFGDKKNIAELILNINPYYVIGSVFDSIFEQDRSDVFSQFLNLLNDHMSSIDDKAPGWADDDGVPLWSTHAHSIFYSICGKESEHCFFSFIDFCISNDVERVNKILNDACIFSSIFYMPSWLKRLGEQYKVDISSVRDLNTGSDLLGHIFSNRVVVGFNKKKPTQNILSVMNYLILSGCNPSGNPDETGYVKFNTNPIYTASMQSLEVKTKASKLLIDMGASLDDLVYMTKDNLIAVSVGSILIKRDKDLYHELENYESIIKKSMDDYNNIKSALDDEILTEKSPTRKKRKV